jgi:hypothetical protein
MGFFEESNGKESEKKNRVAPISCNATAFASRDSGKSTLNIIGPHTEI